MGDFQIWRHGTTTPSRVTDEWVELCVDDVLCLRVGETVELKGDTGQFNGDFLRVASIITHKTEARIFLRGYRMRRTRKIEGFLSSKLNELCMLANISGSDNRPLVIQALEDVPFAEVLKGEDGLCVKRKTIITNAMWPKRNFQFQPVDVYFPIQRQGDKEVMTREERTHTAKHRVLVCRWIYEVNQEHMNGRGDAPLDLSLRRFKEHEADQTPSDKIFPVSGRQLAVRFLKRDPRAAAQPIFADIFCGCGGFTQGALAAGLKLTFGLDNDHEAARTWKLNCPNALMFEEDVFVFLQRPGQLRVDIIHISPPCQSFSPANTASGTRDPSSRQGQRDESNEALALCLGDILRRIRPRIVTVEQTSGIVTQSRHSAFFKGFIRQFTDYDYSLRAKVLNMSSYGVPQHRKRLILIASCPGCDLPTFPVPTHGEDYGLRPRRTVHDVVCRTNESHAGLQCRELLRNIIMTSGTRDTPLGRPFNIAELQDLTTFPRVFGFPPGQGDTTKRKQLGNAVPPRFAEVLLRSIVRTVKKEDARWDAQALRNQDPIDLTEEEEDVRITRRQLDAMELDVIEEAESATREQASHMDLDVAESTRDEWGRAYRGAMARRNW